MKNKLQKIVDFFGYNEFQVEIQDVPKNLPEKENNKYISILANFIDEILGDYCYTTVKNHCPVTVAEALKHGYLFMENGKLQKMDKESLYELVLIVFPKVTDLEEIKKKQEELLTSSKLYPFYKIDATPMNIYNRLRKGGIYKFFNTNIQAFHEGRNRHLQGEEHKTRANIYNTFVILSKLWENHQVPILKSNSNSDVPN